MLPLKLTMQAFGAYLNKVVIPFEKLGTNNIYLICGPCGSGKTTIFDAICYALFSSASTAARGNSSLRSHYATNNTVSFVEFEFLYNNERYIITRYPSQERKKTRGAGVLVQPPKAQIKLPNNKLIAGVKEVDEFILELLGVNKNQFSQIALLAQGEFLKLLNADTKTRGEIFRNIFKTADCLDFQLKLKDKTLNYKQDLDNLNSVLVNSISMLNYDRKDIKEAIEVYNKTTELYKVESFIKKVKKENIKDIKSKEKIYNKIKKLELTYIELEKELEKIKNKESLINRLVLVKEAILLQKKVFYPIKKAYLTLDQKQLKLDNLKTKFQSLSADFEKINSIKASRAALENKNEELKNLDLKLKELIIKKTKIKKEHLNYLYQTYINCKKELEQEKKEFTQLQKQYILDNNDYEKKYQSYLSNQAGVLASLLKDNTPCPVCGSKNHPKKAVITNKETTKELIDRLKKELRKKEELLNKKASFCAVLAQKTKLKQTEFNALKTRYKLAFAKKIPLELDYSKELDGICSLIEKTKNQIQKLNLELVSIKTRIETLKIGLKNSKNIVSIYKKTKNQIDCLNNQINLISSGYLKENSILEGYLSKKELLINQIESLSCIDIKKHKKIENMINGILDTNSKYRNDYQTLSSRIDSNVKLIKKIEIDYRNYSELYKVYSNYKILSDCANGSLKGKPRVAFEQYIQSYYLDMVLYYANKIFKVMTLNQFELLRKKDTVNLGIKTGLDLEVFDYHTYKKRDTKTLSGGESFKASLALALGLSQCVSGFSNTINIDALFIDEGFGSLDSESLDIALDVISSLSYNNRLIGLISHVNELKSRIPNQIIAIKTPFGSNIKLTF